MTNIEVCQDLRQRNARESAENKIYTKLSPPMTQSAFSRKVIEIEAGLSKVGTVEKFFSRFGYVGDWNNFEKK